MRYVLIDRFVELEKGARGVAYKCVTRGEKFMATRGSYPPTLVLEAIFQCAGAVIRSDNEFTRRSMLGKVERAEFPALARPGDRIRIEVEAILSRPEGKLFEGTATVDGTVVGRARFMMLLVPEEMEPPRDAERDAADYVRRRALRLPIELEKQ